MQVSAPLSIAAASLDDQLRIEEVSDCAFFAGDIFRRAFKCEPPDFPHHFVALYQAARNCFVALGYLHCSVVGDLCLCGGLIADERAIRRMPVAHQAALRKSGGIESHLLAAVATRFAQMPALWAMVGDPPVRKIFETAGFEAAPPQYVMVKWNAGVQVGARDDLVRRVGAFGPF